MGPLSLRSTEIYLILWNKELILSSMHFRKFSRNLHPLLFSESNVSALLRLKLHIYSTSTRVLNQFKLQNRLRLWIRLHHTLKNTQSVELCTPLVRVIQQRRQNSETLMCKTQTANANIAEGGSCFFCHFLFTCTKKLQFYGCGDLFPTEPCESSLVVVVNRTYKKLHIWAIRHGSWQDTNQWPYWLALLQHQRSNLTFNCF